MRCLQYLTLKGVASFLGAFYPVLVAIVGAFHFVLVETAAVVASG